MTPGAMTGSCLRVTLVLVPTCGVVWWLSLEYFLCIGLRYVLQYKMQSSFFGGRSACCFFTAVPLLKQNIRGYSAVDSFAPWCAVLVVKGLSNWPNRYSHEL